MATVFSLTLLSFPVGRGAPAQSLPGNPPRVSLDSFSVSPTAFSPALGETATLSSSSTIRYTDGLGEQSPSENFRWLVRTKYDVVFDNSAAGEVVLSFASDHPFVAPPRAPSQQSFSLALSDSFGGTDASGAPYAKITYVPLPPMWYPTYEDAEVVPGVGYYYVMTAVDQAGNESGYSEEVSATATEPDITPPAAPTGLGGLAGWKKATLWWIWGPEPDILGYHVYRRVAQPPPAVGEEFVRITPSWSPHSSNQYTDDNLETGETYDYYVTAVDFSWNESAPSEVFSITLPAADVAAPVITILYPAHNDGTVNRFPRIRARVEDDLTGVEYWGWPIGEAADLRIVLDGADYTEQLRGQAIFIGTVEPNVYSLEIPLVSVPGTALEGGLSEGNHTLEIHLRDIAGNAGTGTSVFYMQPVTVVLDALAARQAALGWQPVPVESDIAAIRQAIAEYCLGFVNPDTGQPWSNIEELLQYTLDRTTWESPVSFAQKIKDIKAVLNNTRWLPIFPTGRGNAISEGGGSAWAENEQEARSSWETIRTQVADALATNIHTATGIPGYFPFATGAAGYYAAPPQWPPDHYVSLHMAEGRSYVEFNTAAKKIASARLIIENAPSTSYSNRVSEGWEGLDTPEDVSVYYHASDSGIISSLSAAHWEIGGRVRRLQFPRTPPEGSPFKHDWEVPTNPDGFSTYRLSFDGWKETLGQLTFPEPGRPVPPAYEGYQIGWERIDAVAEYTAQLVYRSTDLPHVAEVFANMAPGEEDFKIVSVEWKELNAGELKEFLGEELAGEGNNLPLFATQDPNPEEGKEGVAGSGIYPDSEEPLDMEPKARRFRLAKVKVTIDRQEDGLQVFVKSFDVDDPSDKLKPIDDDETPAHVDNRGSPEPGKFESGKETDDKPTDENGVAEFIFEVTLKPGDNFRVAAAKNEDLLDKCEAKHPDPENQARIFKDDAPLKMNEDPPADLKQSPLLTVWRRLWLEVDSMDAPPQPWHYWTEGHSTGLAPTILTDTNQNWTPKAWIGARLIPNWPLDEAPPPNGGPVWYEINVGFRVCDSAANTLTVIVPGLTLLQVAAIGNRYLLNFEGDAIPGDIPDPPVDHLPDVFKRLYIDVIKKEPWCQWNLDWSHNFYESSDTIDEYANPKAPDKPNGRDAPRSEKYIWTARLLGCYESYRWSDDNDPDSELGALGFTHGTSKALTCFIPFEVLRDVGQEADPDWTEPQHAHVRKAVVLHEILHTFKNPWKAQNQGHAAIPPGQDPGHIFQIPAEVDAPKVPLVIDPEQIHTVRDTDSLGEE